MHPTTLTASSLIFSLPASQIYLSLTHAKVDFCSCHRAASLMGTPVLTDQFDECGIPN
jgi:hypothetical protein